MTSQQIQWFLALAEYLNYTEAARYLYISQPALSRQINALEQELECKLFTRSNKEVALTPAGEIMLRHFKEWRRAFELSATEARHTEIMESDHIRVGVIGNLEIGHIADVFSEIQRSGKDNKLFLRRFPHPELTLALAKGDLDIAVTLEDIRGDLDGLETIELFEVGCMLVLSRQHYLAQKEHLSAQDISHLFVAVQESSVATPKLDHLTKSFGYGAVPQKFVNLSNAEEVLDFVCACSGAAIMGMPSRIDEKKFRVYPLEIRRKVVMAWKAGFSSPILHDIISRFYAINGYAQPHEPQRIV